MAIGVQSVLKEQPHLSASLRNQLFTGAELQASFGVLASEAAHAMRTGHFAPETLIVLSFFLDEFLARAVHAKTGPFAAIPIDRRHITRVTTAFASFGASLLGAGNLAHAGRPEVAWALGIAGALNFGEAVLTSADTESLMVRALMNQSTKKAKSTRIELKNTITAYEKAVEHNLIRDSGTFYSIERKIPKLRMRAHIWMQIAKEVQQAVDADPDMSTKQTEQIIADVWAQMSHTNKIEFGPLTTIFANKNQHTKPYHPFIDPWIQTTVEKDLKHVHTVSAQEALFWSLPQRVDERVRAFFGNLFGGKTAEAGDALVGGVAAEPVSTILLTDDEVDLATFWRSVIANERIPDADRKDFIKAMSGDKPAEIRQWLGWLEQEYGEIFPISN